MPCYSPVKAWRSPEGGRLVFKDSPGAYRELTIPCGYCIGCRLDKSRTWAIRIMHEASMHPFNSFVTLTYQDEYLPVAPTGCLTVDKTDLQKFFKRLRKSLGAKKIRYYAVSEYGDQTGRPHYHAIIFDWRPSDLEYYTKSQGNTLYISKTLDSIWGMGRCWVGDVTFESAAYCARYVMKKLYGAMARIYELDEVEPESALMSRRPGIGHSWFQKFRADVFPYDSVTLRDGISASVPRYYSSLLQQSSPDEYLRVKSSREERSYLSTLKSGPKLSARHEVKLAQLRQLLRRFE